MRAISAAAVAAIRGASTVLRRAGGRGFPALLRTPQAPQAATRPRASSSAAEGATTSAAQGGREPKAITLLAVGERGTRALARLLAADRRVGDCYFLRGAVGAGKSAFSRAFVRAAAGNPYLPVPSPTFLLLNTYEVGEGGLEGDGGADGSSSSSPAAVAPIHHFDLYRLDPAKTSPAELVRLDIPGALASGVALVEWPERLEAIAGQQQQQQEGGSSSVASNRAAAGQALSSSSQDPALVPHSRVDVFVDTLAEDDPARAALAEALAGSSSSSSSSGGGRLRAAPLGVPLAAGEDGADAEEDDYEDEDDDSDDDDDNIYADRRWRRWTLAPTSREWEARLRERLRRAAAEAATARQAAAGGGSSAGAGGGGSGVGGLYLIE